MVVVLGASGFIGQNFVRHLVKEGHDYLAVSRADFDYYDPGLLSNFLRDSRPRFLVNAAGYTGRPNVDACEDNKGECLYANSVLPERISRACQQAGIPWGHVSSGCIYSGTRPGGEGFRETDTPNFSFRSNPCSFYAGSKALGEEVIANADCYIWRIRIPFSHVDHPRNYLSKLLTYERLLEVTNSLTHLDEAIGACLDCWLQQVPYGIYNLTNGGSIQTSEVVALLRQTIAPNHNFQFFNDEEEFMRLAAKTPRSNCVLDNSKALAAGLRLSNVHEAVVSALNDWKS